VTADCQQKKLPHRFFNPQSEIVERKSPIANRQFLLSSAK
jgi:hypothetical protein